ncbi:tyrosine-protein phosphatase [Parendozoicomonas sp. Alg238-R29]|uniref:tyrosine-protein phosphatase n=1 Tax=Parendozoicomonas sp. Alg238-R29 TaxID=2993446 RepID=UPI00248DE947|nr:tyrosine-protein phosphatase [Parendozoicomonas sp. Alg238-R29]
MPKLTGNITFTVQEAQGLQSDIENQRSNAQRKDTLTDAQASRLPVRIKKATIAGRTVEAHLGRSTNAKASAAANREKTAKEQVDASVLADRLTSAVGDTDLVLNIPQYQVIVDAPLTDNDLQAGCKIQVQYASGDIKEHRVVSCGHFGAVLQKWIEKRKVEEKFCKTLDALRSLDSSKLQAAGTLDTSVKGIDESCLNILLDFFAHSKAFLDKNPDKQYMVRCAVAKGIVQLKLKTADDILKHKHVFQEAGRAGVIYLQYCIKNLPCEEAEEVCLALQKDSCLGRAALAGFVSHEDNITIQVKTPETVDDWVALCGLHCFPAQSTFEKVDERLTQCAYPMIDLLIPIIAKTESFKPGKLEKLPVPVLERLIQEDGAKPIFAPAKKELLIQVLKGKQVAISDQVDERIAKGKQEVGLDLCNDQALDSDAYLHFGDISEEKLERDSDLNAQGSFVEKAHPLFDDIPTLSRCAVRVRGEKCYPGSAVMMPAGSYMALQAPHKNVGNYWGAILDNNVNVSVSLTREGEIGDPFPREVGAILKYGGYEVRNLHTQKLQGGTLEVHHLLIDDKYLHKRVCMRNWPDHGSASPADLVALAMLVENLTQDQESIAVNCMAGVGRTGTFIAVIEMLRRALAGNPLKTRDELDDLIKTMRKQRGGNTVQTQVQYSTLERIRKSIDTLLQSFRPLLELGAKS